MMEIKMRYSIYRKRNLVGLKNGKLYPISDLFNIFEISFPKVNRRLILMMQKYIKKTKS